MSMSTESPRSLYKWIPSSCIEATNSRAAYRNLGQGGQTEIIEHFHGFMPRGFLSYQQETILNWNRKPHRISI